jgi:hypothetical protein
VYLNLLWKNKNKLTKFLQTSHLGKTNAGKKNAAQIPPMPLVKPLWFGDYWHSYLFHFERHWFLGWCFGISESPCLAGYPSIRST